MRHRYDPRTHGKPVASGFTDSHMFIVRREHRDRFQVRTPSWNGTVTTFRILPLQDDTESNYFGWTPFRLSAEPGHWGDWNRIVPVAYRVGNPSTSFIMYDQADPTVEIDKSPYNLIYQSVSSAVRNGSRPDWRGLIKKEEGQAAFPLLPKPANIMTLQCVLYQHKSKIFQGPYGADPAYGPVLMLLKDSAAWALQSALETPIEGYQGDLMDYANAYAFGDPVSLWDGAFVQMFQEGYNPGMPAAAGGRLQSGLAGAQAARRQQMQNRGKTDDFNKYDCQLVKTFGNWSANYGDEHETIDKLVKPLHEILWFPGIPEQIEMLSRCLPPDVVVFALQDLYRDHIPQFVFDKLGASHHQAVVPVGVPPQGGAGPVGVPGGGAFSRPGTRAPGLSHGQPTPRSSLGATAAPVARQAPPKPTAPSAQYPSAPAVQDSSVAEEEFPPPDGYYEEEEQEAGLDESEPQEELEEQPAQVDSDAAQANRALEEARARARQIAQQRQAAAKAPAAKAPAPMPAPAEKPKATSPRPTPRKRGSA